MKKLFFALLSLVLPLCANAQVDELFQSKRATHIEMKKEKASQAGAVPEVDGKVVFTQTINSSLSKDELFSRVSQWTQRRFLAETVRGEWDEDNYYSNLQFSQVSAADKASGLFVCRGAEILVFSSKFLSKDWTEIYYKAEFKVEEGKITATVSNISYVYAASENQRFKAEEWITDKEAIDKKGKLRKIPGKFRQKTIEMTQQIFKEIGIIAK